MRPCIHSLRPAGFGKVWQSFKMKKIIFATGNQGKMKEIREIWGDSLLQGEEVEILSMKEAGIQTDIVEDGSSFTENAVIKAKAVAALAPDAIVMADDSGLEIDYLNKEPGIYSARYLGENTSYQIKNANLIERLSGVPEEKERQGLSVPLPVPCRMEECLQSLRPLRGGSVTRKEERTALALILFLWCRSTA